MDYYDIIAEEREDGLGIITLNRPDKRNAINIRMRREISDCLLKWSHSSQICTVIFTGAGTAFSSGFDLNEFSKTDLSVEILDSSSRYHRDIWHFPKPTIAAINGPAMGGGFDLALLCDIRICSKSAVFGHPEVKFGAPPLFTPLKWIVGEGLVRDMCLTGRKIDSETAFKTGLVSSVTEDGILLNKAIKTGKEILEAPIDTIMYIKSCFLANKKNEFEEAFSMEHDKAFRDYIFPKARNGLK